LRVEDEIVACPICDTKAWDSTPAWFADFVKHTLDIEDSVEAKSWLCHNCNHVFSTPLLDQKLLSRYYFGYLTEDYRDRRNRFEPGFDKIFPSLIDKAGEYYKSRLDWYDHFFELGDMDGKVIVDYGGGEGYFANILYPKADVNVVDVDYEGDTSTLGSLMRRADLLFATHVFEHIPRPKQTLKPLVDDMRPGSLVYVEVPYDFRGSVGDHFRRAQEHNKITGQVLDTPLVHLHEHLTHYSKRSLKFLMQACGVVVEEIYMNDHWIGIMGHKR
jgi:hypothetical protein